MGKKVSIPAEVIDRMVADVAIKSAIRREHGVRFREEYAENKAIRRERIRTVFDARQQVKSALVSDSDPVRFAVYEVMSQFSEQAKKQELFESYAEFVATQCEGEDPVDPAAFFAVQPERRTGSGLPAQFSRHRPNHLRGLRIASDNAASVSGNYEHLKRAGIEIGSMVYSTVDFKSRYKVRRISAECKIFFEGEMSNFGHDPRDYSPVRD